MAIFSSDNDSQARVLILDCHSTILANDVNAILWPKSMAMRLGCYVEHHSYTAGIPDKVYSETSGWDLIIVPYLGTSTGYDNIAAALAKFQDSTIPVYVIGVYALSSHLTAATPVTGLTTVAAGSSPADRVSTEGMKNWSNRLAGRVTYYCQPYTGWDSTVTEHVESTANELLMWSKTVSGHPCLFSATNSTANNTGTTVPKCYPGFQWMCDQQSTSTKNTVVKSKLNKMHLLMRWDVCQLVDDKTAYDSGYMQTTYDALEPYMSEIHLAAQGWTSGIFPTVASTYPDLAAWLLERDSGNGGMFMVHNHNTDIYDNATEKCSSNHLAFDQFDTAGIAYEADCDDLTGYGFTVGTDGYGKDWPNVQNGNDMDNPSAMFLGGGENPYRVWHAGNAKWYGGYGCAIWLISTEDYPTLPAAVQGGVNHSFVWNGAQVIFSDNADPWQVGTALAISGNWNAALHRMLILGGGLYYHGAALANTHLGGYATEYGQLYTCFPDIITNKWEGMVESQARGIGMLFTD
jgi:hypothetical protein